MTIRVFVCFRIGCFKIQVSAASFYVGLCWCAVIVCIYVSKSHCSRRPKRDGQNSSSLAVRANRKSARLPANGTMKHFLAWRDDGGRRLYHVIYFFRSLKKWVPQHTIRRAQMRNSTFRVTLTWVASRALRCRGRWFRGWGGRKRGGMGVECGLSSKVRRSGRRRVTSIGTSFMK